MTTQKAKKIDLNWYFSSVGIEPQKTTKNCCWYLSPFRKEDTASLKIEGNVWYDFGIGGGGTIIDFGTKYFDCSISDFLKILMKEQVDAKPAFSSFHQQVYDNVKSEVIEQKSINEPKIKVITAEQLINSSLIQYLENRGISKVVAQTYCEEVTYLNGDRTFYSIGFKNIEGGYELRGEGFKACSSPKAVSFFDNGYDKLAIFEGFTDFLSYQMLPDFHIEDSNWLILNSLSFLRKITPYLLSHRQIFLFLDNDAAGNSAKLKVRDLQLNCVDMSIMYADFKDLNNYLLWTTKKC